MSIRKLALIALGFAISFAGAAFSVSAQPLVAPRIGRSGGVYHKAVCAHGQPHGMARCHAHVVTDSRGNPLPGKASPALIGAPAGYGPADLRSAYKITASGSSSTTVAIVDAYGYPNAERDLGVYRAQYGLPPCTSSNGCFRKVNQNGGTYYPYFDLGWSQETALDLQMASAMCPYCKILLVEASNPSYYNLATAVNEAARLGAHAISNSYGGDEWGSQYYESAYSHLGIAVTASAGDGGYGVNFPASSPHVIAVGGTSLTRASNTRGWSETVWSGTGSGCSSVYGKPYWEKDVLCPHRMVGDVSAVADPATAVAVYAPTSSSTSAWMRFGGTSVAAPLIAGIYGANGTYVTYASNPYGRPGQLFDVVSGTNGSCGGVYWCKAGPGYDGPTGLGTPDGIAAF